MDRTCAVYMSISSQSLSPSEISNMLGMTPTKLNLPHSSPRYVAPTRDYGRLWHKSVASNILDMVIQMC